MIGRRTFIAGLGAAAAWPLAARAQQGARMRRVGVLQFSVADDPAALNRNAAFRKNLANAGWNEGRNLRLDIVSAADGSTLLAAAAELLDRAPEVILATSRPATKALQRQTQTIPIVFTNVGDPADIVRNLAHPEDNITGFTNYFSPIAGKWVELIKTAVPGVTSIALIFNRELDLVQNYVANEGFLVEIEKAAKSFAVTTSRFPVENAGDIERAINGFASEPNGALIVVPPPLAFANRELVSRLAIQHRLPWMQGGDGLMSYGPNPNDIIRGASSYVDRLLRGAKPADLPVQFPTHFYLVVNLKSAKAVGVTMPESLLLLADEVIE